MKRIPILPIVFLALSAAFTVASILLLPDSVIIQFSLGGSGMTHAAKLSAIALPLLLSAGGALVALFSKGEPKRATRPLFISGVGLVCFGLLLAVNLI